MDSSQNNAGMTDKENDSGFSSTQRHSFVTRMPSSRNAVLIARTTQYPELREAGNKQACIDDHC